MCPYPSASLQHQTAAAKVTCCRCCICCIMPALECDRCGRMLRCHTDAPARLNLTAAAQQQQQQVAHQAAVTTQAGVSAPSER